MTYTLDRTAANAAIQTPVQSAIASFQRLTADEQLGLLWAIYKNMGRAITPAAPGAARMQFAEGLLNQIKAMPFPAQLQFMRDLVNHKNTPETRAYGVLSTNTQLAFWYQLAVWMETGEVVPVPEYHKLSEAALAVFGQISKLSFNQQITILRQSVTRMGVDPFTA